MSEFLRKDATVVLDFIESLTPGLASVAATFETIAAGPVERPSGASRLAVFRR